MNRCTSKTPSSHQKPSQHFKTFDILFWRMVLTTCLPSVWRRFVRRLLYFYKPSSKLYAGLALDHAKARHLTVVGCQFVEFLMDSDEVREVCTYTQKLTFYILSFSNLPCVSHFLLFSSAPGWPGLPGGPGERHGFMAVLVLRAEAWALSAEQRPAHHTQPTLLPLPGDTLRTPAGSQTAGEMWPVSVVRTERNSHSIGLNCSQTFTHVCLINWRFIEDLLTTILFLQPAESVLCEEPGCRAEARCSHTGLQQRRSGQSDPLQDPHCCYWCKKQRKHSVTGKAVSQVSYFR